MWQDPLRSTTVSILGRSFSCWSAFATRTARKRNGSILDQSMLLHMIFLIVDIDGIVSTFPGVHIQMVIILSSHKNPFVHHFSLLLDCEDSTQQTMQSRDWKMVRFNPSAIRQPKFQKKTLPRWQLIWMRKQFGIRDEYTRVAEVHAYKAATYLLAELIELENRHCDCRYVYTGSLYACVQMFDYVL